MFSEILPRLAVASAYDQLPPGWQRLDVRGLIDGAGNSASLVEQYVSRGLALLKESDGKLVVVCDYGQSRSNFIAAHVYSHFCNVPLQEAIRAVQNAHSDSKIQPTLLMQVIPPEKRNAEIARVAITGGRGFLGGRLCKKLVQTGRSCLPLTRATIGDYLTSSASLHSSLSDFTPDVIVHLAHSKPYNSETSSQLSLAQLVSVVNYCEDNNVRLLYPSSWVVFDGALDTEVTRISRTAPHTRYGRLKVACESFVSAAFLRNLNARIIRLPGLFGFDSLDPRFLRYFAECVATGSPIIYHKYQNGLARVPLSHVDHCVDALASSVLGFDELPMVSHLGVQSITPSVGEIACQLSEVTGIEATATAVQRRAFVGHFVADVIASETSTIAQQIQEFILELARKSNVDAC